MPRFGVAELRLSVVQGDDPSGSSLAGSGDSGESPVRQLFGGLRTEEKSAAFGCLRASEGGALGFPELEVERLRSVDGPLRKQRPGS